MSQQPSLRERKKLRTRELIATTAMRLFSERGFDHVTVTEVAAAADVSRKTVFNYFPTKNDLVLSDLEIYERALLQAVSEREDGESVLTAFGRFVLAPNPLVNEAATDRLLEITRTITGSPALRAREEQILNRCTASMAALLGEQTDGDEEAESWIAAIAMIGIYRGLIVHARGQADLERLPSDLRAQSTRALMLLGAGLDDYAVKSRASSGPGRRRCAARRCA